MLAAVLEKYSDVIYLAARVSLGVVFFIFGVPKLTGLLWDYGTLPVGSLFWFAGLAEVLGGVEMAVAFFGWGLPAGIFPLRPESAIDVLVLIAAFLMVMLFGSGKWGLERLVFKKELF